MRGVAVGVQQRYGDRLDALLYERVHQFGGMIQVYRLQRPTVAVYALVHLAAQVSRRQRFRELRVEVVHIVDLLAAHFEDVSEAARGEQRGLGALAFDDGVGSQRRAVDDQAQRLGRGAGVAQQFADAPYERAGWVFGVSQNLCGRGGCRFRRRRG